MGRGGECKKRRCKQRAMIQELAPRAGLPQGRPPRPIKTPLMQKSLGEECAAQE